MIDEDYTHFVHLAAILGVQNVCENPFETLDANVCLTLNFIKKAVKQRSQPRFIYASTSEVYAGTLASGRLSFPSPESSEILLPDLSEARSSYMLSKIYGEALCSLIWPAIYHFQTSQYLWPKNGHAACYSRTYASCGAL